MNEHTYSSIVLSKDLVPVHPRIDGRRDPQAKPDQTQCTDLNGHVTWSSRVVSNATFTLLHKQQQETTVQ